MSAERFTLTIRLIRSFEHRNIRFLVLKDVDPSCKVGDLKRQILDNLSNSPNFPPPFKNYLYDTLKINSFAHGAKSNDTAILLDHEEWVLEDNDKTLRDYHLKNETELSFYCEQDYYRYKENPQLLW